MTSGCAAALCPVLKDGAGAQIFRGDWLFVIGLIFSGVAPMRAPALASLMGLAKTAKM